MKTYLIVAACLLTAPAFAANQDCGLLYKPGDTVITRDGTATLKSCEPLIVAFKDGTEKTPGEILPVVHPVPLNYPTWAGRMIDPNFEPMKNRH